MVYLHILELVKLVKRTVRSEHNNSLKRPIYLVGESLSGCLALAVANWNPLIDLILILVNPGEEYYYFISHEYSCQ